MYRISVFFKDARLPHDSFDEASYDLGDRFLTISTRNITQPNLMDRTCYPFEVIHRIDLDIIDPNNP